MPVKKTITPDYLVSLEDRRHYKSLKRHLAGRGLTPAEYRSKWGLAADYPMVSPNYAKQRSEMARLMGLGRKAAAPTEQAAPAADVEAAAKPTKSKKRAGKRAG
jgi:predicted transcriptional regulator